MKSMRRLPYLVVFAVVLFGCATTIVTRIVIQPVTGTTDEKAIIDAISYVLINNGFDIAFINENYGFINSAWRPVQSGADTAASVLSIVGSAMSRGPSSYSTYSREMMISFQIFANEYHVIAKLKRKSNTTSVYGGSSREDVEYPTADSSEGKLVAKIIREIDRLLSLADDFQWKEKVVSIGDEPGE